MSTATERAMAALATETDLQMRGLMEHPQMGTATLPIAAFLRGVELGLALAADERSGHGAGLLAAIDEHVHHNDRRATGAERHAYLGRLMAGLR